MADTLHALVQGGEVIEEHRGGTVVPWCSFTKTAIAAAALTLAHDGVLDLDAAINDEPYTLRQLLQHRAGLCDYGELGDYHMAVARGEKPWAVAEMLLSKQFQLPGSEIEKLRNGGQGWGEITIRLALADKLTKTDPTNFPTLSAAQERIETLRNDGKGWGSISKELGFKLGPLVSDVRHSMNELRRDLHPDQLTAGKADDRGDVKREARAERLEQAQRPERLERPERPERSERPERPEKPEHINR